MQIEEEEEEMEERRGMCDSELKNKSLLVHSSMLSTLVLSVIMQFCMSRNTCRDSTLQKLPAVLWWLIKIAQSLYYISISISSRIAHLMWPTDVRVRTMNYSNASRR
jgi:hypothetical protein